jgi:hypothetical protein
MNDPVTNTASEPGTWREVFPDTRALSSLDEKAPWPLLIHSANEGSGDGERSR